MATDSIINRLRQSGCRITKARQAVVQQLEKSEAITADQLYDKLLSSGQKVDKATVYRELKMLVEFGILQIAAVGGEANRYELAGHHHHLVCQACEKITCLDETGIEEALSSFERLIARRHQVTVTGHELYLTGYCRRCKGEVK